MVTLNYSFTAWISHFLACIGGCFGCCTKSTPVIAVDEPSKGLRIQGKSVKRSSMSEDFWSSSACDLDNHSTAMSQRSISSMSTSNQTLLRHGSSNSTTSSHHEFINPGLLLWNQTRLQWTGGNNKTRNQPKQSRGLHSSWNATYESLLTTKHPFRHPIPLSEMVELLVDIWEHEGLYD